MLVTRTITSRLLRGLEPWLTAHGQNSLLIEAGLDPAAASEIDGVIPFEPFLELMEAISKQAGDEAFGLKTGLEQAHASVGLFYYIAVSAPNLAESLARSTLFFGLVTNSHTVAFERDKTGGAYSWNFPDPPSRRVQFTDFSIAVLVGRIRRQIGQHWRPLYVEVDHPTPKNPRDFMSVLGCDVRFDRPAPLIRIDSAALDSKMVDSDPRLYETLEHLGRRMLGLPKEASPFVTKLADIVRRTLPEGTLTDELAAQRLGLSKKSLDRQLDHAGTNFRAVVDDVRSSMTKHLLEETEIPLTELAFLLGYSELSAFSRAAKNWLDESPSSYRKRMRART